MNGNEFFSRMTREAIEELASGEQGWRDVPANTLILACFGMLTNHLTHKLARPLWFFASSVFVGVITYIIINILGG